MTLTPEQRALRMQAIRDAIAAFRQAPAPGSVAVSISPERSAAIVAAHAKLRDSA